MNKRCPRACAWLLAGALLLLGGCTHMRPVEEVLQNGSSWASSQKTANVQAVVAFDEDNSGLISFALFNHGARAGVGPAEKRYRKVVYTMLNSEGGRPIGKFAGIMAAMAMVPDGMPRLKTGDLIEVRFPVWFDYMKDFAVTGEGSAVLRLICPAGSTSKTDSEAFKECASHANWHQPWGEEKRYYQGIIAAPSGRPFAPRLKDHRELAFTPYYDEIDNVLPTAVPMAPRPDINAWAYPELPLVGLPALAFSTGARK